MSLDAPFVSLVDQLWNNLLPHAMPYVIAIGPIVLAFLLAGITWEVWVNYVRSDNFLKTKYVLLEVRLPKETHKSPAAMEVFLVSLHNTANGTLFAQYWKGETRPWYSLEIVSIEGQLKFMIWTEDRRKANLISALYSQFPEVEVHEVEDYAKSVTYDPETMKMWADDFKLSEDAPLPIKTYIDYGLDKDPKEEYKVDPLLPMLEWMGSLGPNQQAWIQVLLIAHIKSQKVPGLWFKKDDLWKKSIESYRDKMMIRTDSKGKVSGIVNEKGFPVTPTLTKMEQEMVSAVERKGHKFAFDVGIRTVFIAKKEVFSTPFAVGGFIGNMKLFSAAGYNSLRPAGRFLNQFDYDWQDYKNMRKNRQSRLALMAYKRRSYFYTPFETEPIVLNVEELATIYHFPGSVAATPTLGRLPSKKAQAPSNLPI